MRRPPLWSFVLVSSFVACASADHDSSAPGEWARDVPRGSERRVEEEGPPLAPVEAGRPSDRCFDEPAVVATEYVTSEVGDHIEKVFAIGSRLLFVHGKEVESMPESGGTASLALAPGYFGFADVVAAGDRVYWLGGGTIQWSSPLLSSPQLVTIYATGGIGLHVDERFVYYAAWLDKEHGYVARHERYHVGNAFPKILLDVPTTRWIGGTSNRLYLVPSADDGASSASAVYAATKPDLFDPTLVASWQNATPNGLVVDDAGVVVALQGDYGNEDQLIAFGSNGGAQTTLAKAASRSIRHLAADTVHAYWSERNGMIRRATRAGSTAETIARSRCRVTTIASVGTNVYVATSSDEKKTRQLWRLPKKAP